MPVILQDISYKYNPGTSYESTALDHINLTIPDGEFVSIIGHTGSGKSTLIQHLNGLLTATEGKLFYNGQNIYEKGYDKKELRTQVGMVFQYPEHQLFESTVFEDVEFGPKNQGLNDEEAAYRAYNALKDVGFPDNCFDQSPFSLSGGQKRRAAIAGVLAMKPAVLILDEPTAGLDPRGRDDILAMITRNHRKSGNTVILVSHSMEDVAEYSDRIIVMDSGRVALDGTPSEVFSQSDTLRELHLDIPRVTALLHILKSRGVSVDTSKITVPSARDEILKCFGI